MPLTQAQLQTLDALQHMGVRLLVVGGRAMEAHGISRTTCDLDLLVARDHNSATALARIALRAHPGVTAERFMQPNVKLAPGGDVDILTSVAGDPDFDALMARGLDLQQHGLVWRVAGLQDLLAIKRAHNDSLRLERAGPNLSEAERRSIEGTLKRNLADEALLIAAIGT